jgi:alpha-mannosidase
MKPPTLHLICNAHLDPVWQWRWEEGCAEALSTFGTAVELLEEHPDLIFNHNEAVLYQWVLEYAPALFGRIQALVEAGRWCISGGWLLQPDLNLPDTESLIRQMVVGRRFFREHFGLEPRVAYNFDSFGHSGGLPQLLVQGGYRMYIHMRPQAPDLALPSDLYRWRGLEGAEILALRIAVGLYHTERDNIVQRLEEGVALALKLNRDVPVFWGIGDHGGGPTREDLRRIEEFRRRENRVSIVHSTPECLYQALQEAGREAPVVTGDLQRVFTGCYTSLARLKRQAVKSLGGLVQTEALRAATWWWHGQEYPQAALDEAWRDHLFNDFHDILPGSCVQPAEEDALNLYGKVSESARRLRLGAAVALNAGPPQRCYIPITLLNANPSGTRVPVEVEAMLDLRPKWSGRWHLRLLTPEGAELPCQEEQPEALLPFNGWRRKVVFLADLPQLGARHCQLEMCEGERRPSAAPPALAHRFDEEKGLVTSLQAGGRECVRGAFPAALVVADTGDAWGADRWSYREELGRFECVPASVGVIERGPIRTIIESVHRFSHSRIVLQTVAYAGWPVLEFRLRIHWQEERARLKLSIPTVFRTPSVWCEVPGGALPRPADGQEHVHRRWLLLEDSADGPPAALGLVHDGFHGFDFQDGEIRLSVVRGAAYCHEQGFKLEEKPARKYMDQGVHEARLLVTAGDAPTVRQAVVGLADWLSAPPAVYAHLPIGREIGGRAPAERPLLQLSPATIRLLACQRSADGTALVVRVQEMAGQSTSASLQAAGMAAPLQLAFKPYEVKTVRVARNGAAAEADLIGEQTGPSGKL